MAAPVTPGTLDAAKDRLCAEVDSRAGTLTGVSRELAAHPELAWEETFAHDLLTTTLAEAGLTVQRSAHGLPTAFVAEAGTTGPRVAVVCEYDALPGIGHACGHNIIAAAGAGAGIAAATLADELGGRVRVVGTPAEEGGGGKVPLLAAGAFDDCVAALMVHPAGVELTEMHAIANRQVVASFTGKAAHAAAAPDSGRNALDAAVLGYLNVAALRQHIADDERIHGIFTHGGDKPNIVPAFAELHFYVRGPALAAVDALCARVAACLEAGAMAAGCTVELDWLEPPYAELVTNEALLGLYVANAGRVGRHPQQPTTKTRITGSTDMGNVSHVVPVIHPMVAVSPPDVAIHTPDFATYAAGPEGDHAVVDAAKTLAMTVVDLWLDGDARDAVGTSGGPGGAA